MGRVSTEERPDRVVSLACKFCEGGVRCFFFPPSLGNLPYPRFFVSSSLRTRIFPPSILMSAVIQRNTATTVRLSRSGIMLLDNARFCFAVTILGGVFARHDTSTVLKPLFCVDYICRVFFKPSLHHGKLLS